VVVVGAGPGGTSFGGVASTGGAVGMSGDGAGSGVVMIGAVGVGGAGAGEIVGDDVAATAGARRLPAGRGLGTAGGAGVAVVRSVVDDGGATVARVGGAGVVVVGCARRAPRTATDLPPLPVHRPDATPPTRSPITPSATSTRNKRSSGRWCRRSQRENHEPGETTSDCPSLVEPISPGRPTYPMAVLRKPSDPTATTSTPGQGVQPVAVAHASARLVMAVMTSVFASA